MPRPSQSHTQRVEETTKSSPDSNRSHRTPMTNAAGTESQRSTWTAALALQFRRRTPTRRSHTTRPEPALPRTRWFLPRAVMWRPKERAAPRSSGAQSRSGPMDPKTTSSSRLVESRSSPSRTAQPSRSTKTSLRRQTLLGYQSSDRKSSLRRAVQAWFRATRSTHQRGAQQRATRPPQRQGWQLR